MLILFGFFPNDFSCMFAKPCASIVLVERTRPFNILFANIQIIIYLRHYKRIYFQWCSDAIENNVKEYEHTLFSSLSSLFRG